MPHYDLVAVARVPEVEGPPQLIELDRIVYNALDFQYGFTDGYVQFGCNPELLHSSIKSRLLELDKFPTEVRVYEHDKIVAGGAITSLTFQGQTLSVYCHGLAYYLRYMYVSHDLNFTNQDQFHIARDLVDHWQWLPWGHYGIDVSNIGTSGINRTRIYLAHELHNIRQRVQELSEVINGFDWWIDSNTRELKAAYPIKGEDKTDTIFLDKRNIINDTTNISVQYEDVASVGIGSSSYTSETSEGSEQHNIFSERFNSNLLETFGRAGIAKSWHDISVQGTLDGHVDKLIADRNEALISIGPSMIPVKGITKDDVDFGDTVTYSYDFGLGHIEKQRRVLSIKVHVDDKDIETLTLGLS